MIANSEYAALSKPWNAELRCDSAEIPKAKEMMRKHAAIKKRPTSAKTRPHIITKDEIRMERMLRLMINAQYSSMATHDKAA
mmetsp:Transcript_39384/g.61944  ORF Transcript_39384/g.61944 Transcript_39384/m.61944 type:complete len:82 (+) Transcript_39384:677-922(+)